MFGKKSKSDVTIEITYRPRVSRLFIFRPLWLVIAIWPMIVLGFWLSLLMFLQFWHMLILGERSAPIWKHEMETIQYLANWQSYLRAFTDTRPHFWL